MMTGITNASAGYLSAPHGLPSLAAPIPTGTVCGLLLPGPLPPLDAEAGGLLSPQRNIAGFAPCRFVAKGNISSGPTIASSGTATKPSVDLAGQQGHRVREMTFCSEHPEAFAEFVGQWVVLEGETIVAHGRNLSTVVSEAKAKGLRVPFVFRVEPKLGKDEGTLGL